MTNLNNQKKIWEETNSSPSQRKEKFQTDADIPIDPVYVPDPSCEYLQSLGFPGEFPFTRGVQPSMYRSRFWTMRQYAGFGSAEDTNNRFKYLLSSGTTGLSVAFDLPTQIGYDSDHALADGEVGKVGVPVSSLQDMQILFKDIPLDKVSTSMTINSTAAILLAFYISVAKDQGVSLNTLSGTIQNDILKEYIARGTYIYPPHHSMRIITDIFKYCNEKLPRWNTISISGYHIREAGSDAVQEVAFTLSNAIAYVEAAISAGLDIDNFASRLSFFFNAHNNFFEEIAKFRAARRLWATIMRERFKAKSDKSLRLRFHTQTAGSTLTAQQPENNIVRVTLQALAAVLGGSQSLHTNSFDEALALPTETSVRTALRTQQIIAHESGVADTCDPVAGSYYIEYLTDQIEEKARAYIRKVDEMDGAVEAIKQGFFQEEITRRAYEHQQQVEEGGKIIIGVNKYMEEGDKTPDTLNIDEKMIQNQIRRLADFKKKRNVERTNLALQQLKTAATGKDNLMPLLINCVDSQATLGEIADCLRQVFGTHQEGNA
jgi:methylmalonyl-CoA mutase N-terminal domain/subunit